MKGRRPHLSRTVIGLLSALALWTAVSVVLFRLVDRPSVRAWLTREVATRASKALGMPVAVGDVRLRWVPPQLTLVGVAVGPVDNPAIRVASLEMTTGNLRLAERELVLSQVRATGVRVNLTLPERGESEESSPWIRVVVRSLEVTDVQIDRLELPTGLALAAHDIELRWAGSSRRPASSAVAHIGAFTLAVPGLEPLSGSVSAWGRATEGGWEVRRLRGEGPGWQIDGRGEGRWAGKEVRASAVGRVELERVDRLVGIGAGLEGETNFDLNLTSDGHGLRIEGVVGAPKVAVAGFTFRDLASEVHLSPDGIEGILGRAVFAGGTLEGSYVLASLGPPWSHRVALRGDGVDLAGFLSELGVDDGGLASRCRVSADLAWDGARIGEGRGTAVVDLGAREGDVPVEGRVVLSLESDAAMHIAAPSVTLAGAPVRWEGTLALGSWVPNWALRGDGLRVGTVARMLRGWVGADVLPADLGGEIAADLRLRGPFQDLTVVGQVAVAPISLATVEADGLEGSFRAGQGVLSFEDGTIVVGPGRVRFDGELRYGEGGTLQVDVRGRNVPIARMVTWAGVNAPLAGSVEFEGSLCGTVDSPSVEATLGLHDVAVAGIPFGTGSGRLWLDGGVVRVEDLDVGPFKAAVKVDVPRRQAVVDASLRGFGLEGLSPALARLLGGALDCSLRGAFPFDEPAGVLRVTSEKGMRGTVSLDREGVTAEIERAGVWALSGRLRRERGGGFLGHADYSVGSVQQVLEELLGGEAALAGRLEGSAKISVPERGSPRVEGVISRLELEAEGEHGGLREPARFSVEGGAIRVEGATLVGPASSLTVRGSRAADGTLAGSISGGLPAALVTPLLWNQANPRGRVEVEISLGGTDKAPRFEGVAKVADGSIRIPGLPAPLTGAAGVLEFVPEAIRLRDMRFRMGTGGGVANGQVILDPTVEFDLGVRAEAVRWPLSTGFAPALSGEVRVSGPLQALSVSGDLTVDRSVFRQDLTIQRLILQQLTAPVRAVATDGAPITFNLHITVPSTFDVDTELAKITAKGDLRLVGTSIQPGLLGRLETLPGGELNLSGVRYEIDRATVTFSDPERIDPFLDLVARTTVDNYEVTVALLGTLERLTPTFTSTPPLPETDILGLLAMGHRPDQSGQQQAGTMASSFITDQLAGVVSRRARTLFAVDQFRLDPATDLANGNPTARMTVAKQLSPDVMVTVATNLDSNREEVVTVRWRLGVGFYLEALRDADSSYSLEVKWQRRY